MYIYNDYRLIQEHVNYIEKEKTEIISLMEWSVGQQSLCTDPVQLKSYKEIYSTLDRLRVRMESRMEILGEIVRVFSEGMENVEDETDRIIHALDQVLDN